MKKPEKKRIKISSAKAKGRACQQWVCRKISTLLRIRWGKDELIASREMGQAGVDVRLIGDAKKRFPWSVECKWQESWSIPAWIDQAKDNQQTGTDWLLICKRSRSDYIAVLDAEVFFDLLRMVKQYNCEGMIAGRDKR